MYCATLCRNGFAEAFWDWFDSDRVRDILLGINFLRKAIYEIRMSDKTAESLI